VYQQAVALGKEEAVKANTDAVNQAREEGAQAENQRIQNIEAISVPDSEEIVAKNKFDREQTAESVSKLILDAQKKKVEKDAEDLGQQANQLGDNQPDDDANDPEAKAVTDAMVSGLNSRK
jgi:hypothetical protein